VRKAAVPWLWSILLLLFVLRWFLAPPQPPGSGLEAWRVPGAGPPSFFPDLQRSDPLALSWLPGVGPGRAQAIVESRAQLDVPLIPERLALVPGVGKVTAARVSHWYQRQHELQGEPMPTRQ